MKTISIANLKGGVGKTVTAINLAYILAEHHGRRVLLLDNDQQGNASKFFERYSYERASMADVLTEKHAIRRAIVGTDFAQLSIVPANLNLAGAERTVLMDSARPQQSRIKMALQEVWNEYDYAIIDNAPSLGMCTINAMTASDYLVVPARIDSFTFDGIDNLLAQADQVREYFNPGLNFLGTLITGFTKWHENDRQGVEFLRAAEKYRAFQQMIRYTDKVSESTFAGKPVPIYSPTSGAARDYVAWTGDLLKMIGDEDDGI